MKKLIVLVALLLPVFAFGEKIKMLEDCPTCVISAEELNEIHVKLNRPNEVVVEADLTGEWDTTSYVEMSTLPDSFYGPSWERTPLGTARVYRGGKLYFNEAGHSIRMSDPNPFNTLQPKSLEYLEYEIVTGLLFISWDPQNFTAYRPQKTSSTQITLTRISPQNAGRAQIVIMDKVLTPPATPTALTFTTTTDGTTSVTLSWIDSSDDETKFVVLSKTNVSDLFTEAGRTDPNITEYTETISVSSWYRVRAANAAGASDGSNVVFVSLEPQ